MRQTQLLLGHEDLQTTARYLSYDLDELARSIDTTIPPLCEDIGYRTGNAPNARSSPDDKSLGTVDTPESTSVGEVLDESTLRTLVRLTKALSPVLNDQ